MTDTTASTAFDRDHSPARPPRREYDVPADATSETCPDCGRPFPDVELLALHRGHAHGEVLTPGDRETVEHARAAESRNLRLFRLKALAVLVVLYFGLLMVYAVVT